MSEDSLDAYWSTRSRQSSSSGGISFSVPSTADATAIGSISAQTSSTKLNTDECREVFSGMDNTRTPTVRQGLFRTHEHDAAGSRAGSIDYAELESLIDDAKLASAELKTKIQALEHKDSDPKASSTAYPKMKSISHRSVEVCLPRVHHSYAAELCSK